MYKAVVQLHHHALHPRSAGLLPVSLLAREALSRSQDIVL